MCNLSVRFTTNKVKRHFERSDIMKNIVRYACILMIVIAGYCLIFETYLILRGGLAGPAQFTFSFINHVAMLITGIMGLKYRDDNEKQKMLAGISGMQTIFCLLAVVICNSLWLTVKAIGIGDWLSITCSIVLLVYYIKGAVRVKKENMT